MMAGHPSAKRSIDVGKRLAASGIAALEIGIPHSDPLADGPVIQRAGQKALAAGMTVAGALEVADGVAREGIPVVLMTYINPVLSYNPRKFAAEAAQAGAAGVIVPDLPIEEAEPVTGWLRAASLDTVFMVAPTTLPVAAGFGISRQDHLKALRGKLDAAVVGSAIVDEIDRAGDGVSLVRELL